MGGIEVRHNVEMGHRLSLQPDSKCFHLHGHSWWVTLQLYGPKDVKTGMIVDFGTVKSKLREFLDSNFDHHMLLNENDPLLRHIASDQEMQWGIVTMDGDPTVENFAQLVLNWAESNNPFQLSSPRMYRYRVHVSEAATNAAIAGTE